MGVKGWKVKDGASEVRGGEGGGRGAGLPGFCCFFFCSRNSVYTTVLCHYFNVMIETARWPLMHHRLAQIDEAAR